MNREFISSLSLARCIKQKYSNHLDMLQRRQTAHGALQVHGCIAGGRGTSRPAAARRLQLERHPQLARACTSEWLPPRLQQHCDHASLSLLMPPPQSLVLPLIFSSWMRRTSAAVRVAGRVPALPHGTARTHTDVCITNDTLFRHN